MKLTPHETNTPLWVKLSEYYATKLAKYRSRIEQPRITEAERVQLAWQIQGIKELLELAEPDREAETDAG